MSALIDKQPAQITSLHSAKEDKLLFALLIDVSASENKNAESIRSAAKQLFQSLAAPGNQGYLVAFNHTVAMSKRPLQTFEAIQAIDGLKFGGGTALYDAIGQACSGILSRSGNPSFARRVILLLSDGEDNSSRLNRVGVDEIAAEEGVAIFSLKSRKEDTYGSPFPMEAGKKTGGRLILEKELAEGVTPLLNAISEQWALDLVPPKAPDKKSHRSQSRTRGRTFN